MSIEIIGMDHDGTLTDGRVITGPNGEEYFSYCSIDGKGIELAHEEEYRTLIITGQRSDAVGERAEKLDCDLISGSTDKAGDFERKILDYFQLDWENVAYIGNDINDTGIMEKAEISAAVGNATDEAQCTAQMVTERPGGHGAVRNFIDYLIRNEC